MAVAILQAAVAATLRRREEFPRGHFQMVEEVAAVHRLRQRVEPVAVVVRVCVVVDPRQQDPSSVVEAKLPLEVEVAESRPTILEGVLHHRIEAVVGTRQR